MELLRERASERAVRHHTDVWEVASHLFFFKSIDVPIGFIMCLHQCFLRDERRRIEKKTAKI
jgi:hypothetical protein